MKRVARPIPIAVTAAVLALVGLLAYGVSSKGSDRSLDHALASGKHPPAPALDLPRLDGGGSLSLASLRGKVVLVNYWASWCPPCRDEAPLLERWHKRMLKGGGTVLGVDVLDTSGDARAFMREHHLTYPSLRDGDGRTQGRFGVGGYPESFVIDRQGRVVALRRGTVDDRFMRTSVEPLLEKGT